MTRHPDFPAAARAGRLQNQRGLALLTVLVFSFVFIVGVMAFFAVASYEANQTEVREHSTRAFYLADGAIDRAKVDLLANGRWDDGYAWTNFDGGSYKLTVNQDTTWNGQPAAWFYAEGRFGRTKRDVEVFADIVPPAWEIAILALGDINTQGNICLDGHAHANEEMDGDNFRDDCPGTFDGGYTILPPPAYTEPDSFPGATYYYVTAQRTPTKQLYVKDRNGATLYTYTHPASPHPEITWDINNSQVLSIDYRLNGPGPHALDDTVGVFVMQGADTAVVINFGEGTAGKHDVTNILVQATGNVDAAITSTIINARFTGITTLDRLDQDDWEGGELRLRTATAFAPRLCISMIVKSLDKGNAQVQLGTAQRPALTYIMGDADWSQGQLSVTGTIIALGDMSFGGGIDLTYNRAFIGCLPPALRENWPTNVSGEMKILEWKEPPPKPVS
jgi:hypothetical protein